MKGTEEEILNAFDVAGIEIEVESEEPKFLYAAFYFEGKGTGLTLCKTEEDAVGLVRGWMISDMEDGIMAEYPKFFQTINFSLGLCEDIASLRKVYKAFLRAISDILEEDPIPSYHYGLYSLLEDEGEESRYRKNLLHEGEEEK